jgi:hypothetical protein
MSWFWLGLLALAGAALWIRRRATLRRDALLQESIDRLGSYSDEPKRPPAKQPWQRPGFGPPARMSRANLGDGPLPPPAGNLEDPDLAGPVPDDEDVPTLIPVEPPEDEAEPDTEPGSSPKPPPPPPPVSTEEVPTLVSEAGPAASEPAGSETAEESTEPTILDIGDPEADVELTVVRGPRVLDLPPELAEEVRGLMHKHQEVAAVRLVCDSMGVGIIDAQRTVRALVGR